MIVARLQVTLNVTPRESRSQHDATRSEYLHRDVTGVYQMEFQVLFSPVSTFRTLVDPKLALHTLEF
jgi:hypothetical protein